MTSWATYGANTSNTNPTQLVAADNAKPATWDEVVSSTSFDVNAIYLWARAFNNTIAFAIDIGTGAASSETVVIENILLDDNVGGQALMQAFHVPTISSGTRIAIRAEGTGTSNNNLEYVMVVASDWIDAPAASPTITTYGVTLGSTEKNTQYDPGGSAHTKNGWTELTPGSAAVSGIDFYWVVIGRRNNTVLTSGDFLFDIGVGSPGAQTAVIQNMPFRALGTTDFMTPVWHGPFRGDDISSQRIWVQAQSQITDATDRLFGVSLVTAS